MRWNRFQFYSLSPFVHGIHHDIAFLQAVCPFLVRIPVKDRELFMDDLVQKALKTCIRPNGDGNENEIILPHSDVIVYAKKNGVRRL